jgi:hypothetical protein
MLSELERYVALLESLGGNHMNEDEAKVSTLVPSRNPGRYALHEQDGGDVTTGQPLAILLGGHWTHGRIEHSNYPSQQYPDAAGCYALTGMEQIRIGYYFVARGGSVCGLCTGMLVRLSGVAERE